MPDHELFYLLLDGDEVPTGTSWLSPRESAMCESFRFPKRRGDWLLGRWTAKQALLQLDRGGQRNPAGWEILADESGAPVAHRNGRAQSIQLSLSHSNGRCLCALSHAPLRLGCDIEQVESRSLLFEETYFDQAEIELLDTFSQTLRASAVTLVWSAKESVLKALRTGLSSDTLRARIVEVDESSPRQWRSFGAIDAEEGNRFTGWWKEDNGMVMTVAANAPTREPVLL